MREGEAPQAAIFAGQFPALFPIEETVDGRCTKLEGAAEVAMLFAALPSNALTGQSLVISHGWFMR